jgi:signal transduction histidine kinase
VQRPWRLALGELVRAALGRASDAEPELPSEAQPHAPIEVENGRVRPGPEEIAELVEGLLGDAQASERLARERAVELERRLVERGVELVALAEELRRSHHETKLQRRAFERMLERVGHGLAAPLGNLVGLVEAAGDSRPLEAGRAWLLAAARIGRGLLTDLASWHAEANRDHEPPGSIEFGPAAVVERVVERARTLADARGLLLEVYDRIGPRFAVLGDPILFERVVEAFVQHGLECACEGFVALELWSSTLEDGVAVVQVHVEDTGEGEPSERAQQLERAGRALVERLGGWIERHRDAAGRRGWRVTLEFPLPHEGRRADHAA